MGLLLSVLLMEVDFLMDDEPESGVGCKQQLRGHRGARGGALGVVLPSLVATSGRHRPVHANGEPSPSPPAVLAPRNGAACLCSQKTRHPHSSVPGTSSVAEMITEIEPAPPPAQVSRGWHLPRQQVAKQITNSLVSWPPGLDPGSATAAPATSEAFKTHARSKTARWHCFSRPRVQLSAPGLRDGGDEIQHDLPTWG